MKVGLIARAEDRGLGIQTWEMARHLQPERVLVVDVDSPEGFPLHLDRYPGATVARLNGGRWLPETLVRDWLGGLDVVLSCETIYDWRVCDWAREAGVATVVQLNPEMFHHEHSGDPWPTVWWNPTTWRMAQLPAGTRHVPVPVALDRFTSHDSRLTSRESDRPLRVLHVIGRPALADRNGTDLLARALRRLSNPPEVTVTRQRPGTGHVPGARQVGELADYWRLYDDQDVLVLPRRYGGLCLVAQEAAAAGLALVMPNCPPNAEMWPLVPVAWSYRGTLEVPCGTIPLVETRADDLAAVLHRLGDDAGFLELHQARARQWAVEHSWDALLPLYALELARAADLGRRSLTA